MKYEAILFDLDGTLFPISNEKFQNVYLKSLSTKFAKYIDPKLLLKSMWEALDVMVNDRSSLTNDEVFYQAFGERIGTDLVQELKPEFDQYYLNEFTVLKDYLDDNSAMIEAIKMLKKQGYKLVIATNPMFPPVAVEQRIRFSGLKIEDFIYFSDFEKHTRTKPNPEYYQEVCTINHLDPKHCLMVGNDTHEDTITKEIGMDAWLITDYLIDSGKDCSDWKGTRSAFLEKVKEELVQGK